MCLVLHSLSDFIFAIMSDRRQVRRHKRDTLSEIGERLNVPPAYELTASVVHNLNPESGIRMANLYDEGIRIVTDVTANRDLGHDIGMRKPV